ncbi:MAG: hypothetical protein OEW33_08920 [Nitrospirota bacterium]|nr:hypothetical protein [Nitrospirota bacterium]MDH4360841.1 hypothetical protein [Nitrospirota bacterium]
MAMLFGFRSPSFGLQALVKIAFRRLIGRLGVNSFPDPGFSHLTTGYGRAAWGHENLILALQSICFKIRSSSARFYVMDLGASIDEQACDTNQV